MRSLYSSLEDATELKFAPFCSFRDTLSYGVLFPPPPGWAEMEQVYCCLEDHLFASVYEHVFHPNGDTDTLRDQSVPPLLSHDSHMTVTWCLTELCVCVSYRIFVEHLSKLSDTITASDKSIQIPFVSRCMHTLLSGAVPQLVQWELCCLWLHVAVATAYYGCNTCRLVQKKQHSVVVTCPRAIMHTVPVYIRHSRFELPASSCLSYLLQ